MSAGVVKRVQQNRACIASGRRCTDPMTCLAYGPVTVLAVAPVGVVGDAFITDVSLMDNAGASVVRWTIRPNTAPPIDDVSCQSQPPGSPRAPGAKGAQAPTTTLTRDHAKKAAIFLTNVLRVEPKGDGPGMVKILQASVNNDVGVRYLEDLKACMAKAQAGEPCAESPLTCQPLRGGDAHVDGNMKLSPEGVRIRILS